MKNETAPNGQASHRKLVKKLVLMAVAMFGFGFAMWPIYNVFCDLTGLGGRGVKVVDHVGVMEKSDRLVKVRFDATVNSSLPWVFQAKQKSTMVTLGEMSEATYVARNPTDVAITGQAIYNVTPPEASLYFVKTECFCFTQQILQANESREMPVFYFIQPDLPDHIKEITLSYTFFRNETADTAVLSGQAGSSVAAVLDNSQD